MNDEIQHNQTVMNVTSLMKRADDVEKEAKMLQFEVSQLQRKTAHLQELANALRMSANALYKANAAKKSICQMMDIDDVLTEVKESKDPIYVYIEGSKQKDLDRRRRRNVYLEEVAVLNDGQFMQHAMRGPDYYLDCWVAAPERANKMWDKVCALFHIKLTTDKHTWPTLHGEPCGSHIEKVGQKLLLRVA